MRPLTTAQVRILITIAILTAGCAIIVACTHTSLDYRSRKRFHFLKQFDLVSGSVEDPGPASRIALAEENCYAANRMPPPSVASVVSELTSMQYVLTSGHDVWKCFRLRNSFVTVYARKSSGSNEYVDKVLIGEPVDETVINRIRSFLHDRQVGR